MGGTVRYHPLFGTELYELFCVDSAQITARRCATNWRMYLLLLDVELGFLLR